MIYFDFVVEMSVSFKEFIWNYSVDYESKNISRINNRSFIYLLAISLIQYVFDKRFENIEKCMGYLFDFVLNVIAMLKFIYLDGPYWAFLWKKNSLIDTSTTFRYFMFSPSFFHRLYTQKRAIQSHYETVYIIKNIVDWALTR